MFDFIIENIVEPLGDAIVSTVEAAGSGIVNVVEATGSAVGKVIDATLDSPVETILAIGVGVGGARMIERVTEKVAHTRMGAIPYGENKKDGTHDHRTNRGGDRTPAQRQGDLRRKGNHSDSDD